MRTRRSRALLAIVGGSVILGSLGGGGALAIGQSAKVSLTDAGGWPSARSSSPRSGMW
jgi:hypothetical protein